MVQDDLRTIVSRGASDQSALARMVTEQAPGSGAEFLRAFVVGWEMFVRLRLVAPGSFSKRGCQFAAAADWRGANSGA